MGRPPYNDTKNYSTFTWPFKAITKKAKNWSFFWRELWDGFCMSWIGMIRGAIAVSPIAYWEPHLALMAVFGNALMGLAYYIGWRVPFTITDQLRARTTEWGEMLTGFFCLFMMRM